VDIERLGPGDEEKVTAAGALFDHQPMANATDDFLARDDHYLFVAYDEAGAPGGFITGVLMVHPDKGREMFLYELAVSETHRRRGYATALIRALEDAARAAECYGMFVLTDLDNHAALGAYTGAGAHDDGRHQMLAWDFAGD
jgi:ribosomal protein S18 acetylase RimI-like enzyme